MHVKADSARSIQICSPFYRCRPVNKSTSRKLSPQISVNLAASGFEAGGFKGGDRLAAILQVGSFIHSKSGSWNSTFFLYNTTSCITVTLLLTSAPVYELGRMPITVSAKM